MPSFMIIYIYELVILSDHLIYEVYINYIQKPDGKCLVAS